MSGADIAAAVAPLGLMVAGRVEDDSRHILLLAPDEPSFWAIFTASPEFLDGQPDPMDRWSKRVIGGLAETVGGTALFPSDGPPYPPFYTWAVNSQRCWPSPVNLLVHDVSGLFISFRGAIVLDGKPAAALDTINPCQSCAGQPCTTACPAGALTEAGYDVPRCHAFLDTDAGQDCMTNGCRVRRACPVGQNRRHPDQSAFHMRHFHK